MNKRQKIKKLKQEVEFLKSNKITKPIEMKTDFRELRFVGVGHKVPIAQLIRHGRALATELAGKSMMIELSNSIYEEVEFSTEIDERDGGLIVNARVGIMSKNQSY